MTDVSTLDQRSLIAAIRDQLKVDTSDLSDIAMWARIAILKELINNLGIDTGKVLHFIEELSDTFMDYGKLVGEMVASTEGTRQ